MKTALFGGTFDPVHLGHLAVARAAADHFDLGRVYFVPADLPPHKQKRPLTNFQHRFAMLALATADDPRFVPSLLDSHTGQPNYSIDTVRRLKATLRKSDKLYFLIGMDAFKDIASWYKPVELLAEVEFIVVSRPGSSLADIGKALPGSLRPNEATLRAVRHQRAQGTIAVPGATIHLLGEVHERASSTHIRAAAHKSVTQLSRFVPRLVAEYIKKERLYIDPAAARSGLTSGVLQQRQPLVAKMKLQSGVERSDSNKSSGHSALRPPTRRSPGSPARAGFARAGVESACIRSTKNLKRSTIAGGLERSDKKKVLSFEEPRHPHAGRSHKNG
ncbi:MAG TPA: nicotinate (nicotinamide) nucleotide adenylyltransferase [Candidatus Angelobacter sp.]|nr:nicotinate (nicotinamide) nucleotide adenylyltransferase [Candidatus Angelobacter sp.]